MNKKSVLQALWQKLVNRLFDKSEEKKALMACMTESSAIPVQTGRREG